MRCRFELSCLYQPLKFLTLSIDLIIIPSSFKNFIFFLLIFPLPKCLHFPHQRLRFPLQIIPPTKRSLKSVKSPPRLLIVSYLPSLLSLRLLPLYHSYEGFGLPQLFFDPGDFGSDSKLLFNDFFFSLILFFLYGLLNLFLLGLHSVLFNFELQSLCLLPQFFGFDFLGGFFDLQ